MNYFAVEHSSDCFSFIKDWVEKKIRRHPYFDHGSDFDGGSKPPPAASPRQEGNHDADRKKREKWGP